MTKRFGTYTVLGFAIAVHVATGAGATAQAPLAMHTARITISGTSNVHPYTASTSDVRVTRAQMAAVAYGGDSLANTVKPGAIEAFEVAVAAATLTSPREGLDKNMHKALNVERYPEITFRLVRLDTSEAGGLKAIGLLKVAGVEREIALALETHRIAAGLAVKGQTQLVMTDYGIKPPTAMLGMLKTDPKVTIIVETVLTIPLT